MELAVNSSGPASYLVVHNIYLLELVLKLVVVFCLVLNLLLHLQNVFILELNILFLSSSCIGFRINFEIMKSISKHFVVLFQNVEFFIAITNILQQIRVGLLPCQESFNKFLNVSYSCSGLDSLESFVDLVRISHLFLHFLSHEGIPQFLNVKVLPILYLRLVLAIISSLFCDLLILLNSLHSLLNGLFLILKALSNFCENCIGICVLLFDVLHESVDGVLGLQSLLLD